VRPGAAERQRVPPVEPAAQPQDAGLTHIDRVEQTAERVQLLALEHRGVGRLVARAGGVGYIGPVTGACHNVGSWPARRAATAPGRLALVDAERRLDWGRLAERCGRLAGWLRSRGVGRGDRVALLLANRTPYLEAVFACGQLGAIATPVNARLAPPEIQFVLEDCTPRVLLHESALAGRAEAAVSASRPAPETLLPVGGDGDRYEAALAEGQPSPPLPVEPDHPLLLTYTSGTTGVPKGALLPHRKTLFNSLNAQLFFQLGGQDRVLVPLPLFHSFGLSILSLPALYAGAAVFLEPRFDAEGLWQRVEKEGITFFGAVPTMFAELLGALDAGAGARRDRASLRFLFSAGAAIPVELIGAYAARGLVVKQGFGQTETSILCCLDAEDAVRKAGSVGKPVFHADLRLVRRESLARPPGEWEDCAPGEPGEIVVRGPITMLGYWRRPRETAETLRDGWLRTGDLATVDEEGFYTLVGRARDMYISGGENVYPAEVEAAYRAHPAIREIAVRGVPDPRWGEVGRAWVVLEPGHALDPEALRSWGAGRLARYKLPRSFVAVERLPRTETGKVQKHRLP